MQTCSGGPNEGRHMGTRTRSYMSVPLIITFLGGVLVFVLARKVDLFEALYNFTRAHEEYDLDELFSLSLYLWFAFGLLSSMWAYRLYQTKKKLATSNEQLRKASTQIKTLEGLLPICSGCKKIRIDDSTWEPLEEYISQHSEATFSHSICPDCIKKLYPDLNLEYDK